MTIHVQEKDQTHYKLRQNLPLQKEDPKVAIAQHRSSDQVTADLSHPILKGKPKLYAPQHAFEQHHYYEPFYFSHVK